MFHVVASTGRTATSLLANAFDRLPGVAACHEGHQRDDTRADLLPLINLENRRVFRDAAFASKVVAGKRSPEIIRAALATTGASALVDVAYYNVGIADAILDLYPESRAVGIIRDCESFVRSVTWLQGTDPMPVGWPAPGKELTPRERFIAMGRAHATQPPESERWDEWGAIARNIWLWRASNDRLVSTKEQFPQRVTLLDFGVVRSEGIASLARRVLDSLGLGTCEIHSALPEALAMAQESRNQRQGGYQIGPSTTWTESEQALLEAAVTDIDARTRLWMK